MGLFKARGGGESQTEDEDDDDDDDEEEAETFVHAAVRDMLEKCFNQVYGRVPAKSAKGRKKDYPYDAANPMIKVKVESPELIGPASGALPEYEVNGEKKI